MDGGSPLSADNPFAHLASAGLPDKPAKELVADRVPVKERLVGKGTRLELRRLKAGKGGKTVTEIKGLDRFDARMVENWQRELKSRFATGGALKQKVMEIQGDHREGIASYFKEKGFTVVLAGG
jgi:translation initiation factor 1